MKYMKGFILTIFWLFEIFLTKYFNDNSKIWKIQIAKDPIYIYTLNANPKLKIAQTSPKQKDMKKTQWMRPLVGKQAMSTNERKIMRIKRKGRYWGMVIVLTYKRYQSVWPLSWTIGLQIFAFPSLFFLIKWTSHAMPPFELN